MRSKAEVRIYEELRTKLGLLTYEPVTYPWVDPRIRKYTPDFFLGVNKLTDKLVYLEVKGMPSWFEVNKVKFCQEQNNIEVWVLLLSNTKVNKKRYWLDVYLDAGIRTAAAKHLPTIWLEDLKDDYHIGRGSTTHSGIPKRRPSVDSRITRR